MDAWMAFAIFMACLVVLVMGLDRLGRWLRSDALWNGVFDLDLGEKPRPIPLACEPKASVVEVPPREIVLRDFGPHHNPLHLEPDSCTASFEQKDARTWQCPTCQLIRFERIEAPDVKNVGPNVG